MSKLILTHLTNLTNDTSVVNTINNNSDAIVAIIDTLVSRDGTAPNTLTATLDANNQNIINLPTPTLPSHPLRLQDVPSVPAITAAAVAAAASAVAAAASASTASNAANSAVTSGAISIVYTFDTTTADADPGAGKLRLSSATQNTSTVIRTDLLDNLGSDWTNVLATLGDSTNTIKGHFRLFNKTDPTKFIIFTITSLASPSGYKNFTVVVVSSSSANPFVNGDSVVLSYSRAGDKGTAGSGSGDVLIANNLSEFTATAGTALTNLGGTTTGKAVFNAASTAAARTAIGTVIGTDVEAHTTLLTNVGALSVVAGDVIYGTGVGTVARLAKGSDTQVLTLASGLPSWATPSSGGSVGSGTGRLTLTSATPVLITTVNAAATVYYTPYVGQYVPIYNGTTMTMADMGGELSNILANSATGKAGPAATTTNSNYDLFVWNDSGTYRLTRGPAWTSDTVRGVGAGTTELARVKGIVLNNVAITNGPGAQLGTYVGTVRTNGTSTVDHQYGALSAGGTAGFFGVWNQYNRKRICSSSQDNTNSWGLGSTIAFQAANSSTTMRTSFITGLAEDGISAHYNNFAQVSGTNNGGHISLGYDSTSAAASGATIARSTATGASSVPDSLSSHLYRNSDAGFHYVQAIEGCTFNVTGVTFYGDNGASTLQSGLGVEIFA